MKTLVEVKVTLLVAVNHEDGAVDSVVQDMAKKDVQGSIDNINDISDLETLSIEAEVSL